LFDSKPPCNVSDEINSALNQKTSENGSGGYKIEAWRACTPTLPPFTPHEQYSNRAEKNSNKVITEFISLH